MIATPGQQDALSTILLAGVAGMPGCLSYTVAKDPTDSNALWITEVWESQASHAASLTLPSVKNAIAQGRPLIAGFGERFETEPIGGQGFGEVNRVPVSVAPMLSVRNGARAVEFYKAAFGATEVYRMEDPSGAVVAQLAVAGAAFWLSDESPEHGNFSPQTLGGGSVRMILTVPDPDSMFAKAIAAGAGEVSAVEEAYGWRVGRVVDPFGHHWEIGRPLKPISKA